MDEANWPTGFDMDHFKSLTSFKSRMEYCKANLQYIAGGSGRAVYKIDDETVIKLAKNQKGIAQNEAENNGYIQRASGNIVANVLDSHPDDLWIESQLAKKVTPNSFKRLSGGISIEEVSKWFINNRQRNTNQRPFYSQDEEIEEEIDNHEFFSEVMDMCINMGLNSADFQRLSSYGEVDGDLVIVDYGLSQSVSDTHYSRKLRENAIRGIIRDAIESGVHLG